MRVFFGAVSALVIAGWQMIIPAAITAIAGVALGRVYIKAQLPVKRLMSNSKAPILGHVQNALVGLGERCSSQLLKSLLTFL